jgi:acyl-CoA synthetase (AMP-forming)/AMP-acid ligase II
MERPDPRSALDKAALPTLAHQLQHWAERRPDATAYTFIDEQGDERASLTFVELDRRARVLASLLAAHGKPGERAMLLFDPGLEFLVAFFGCLYAGVIAVPMLPPRRNKLRDSTLSIFRNCAPAFALTVSKLRDSAKGGFATEPAAADLAWIALDELDGLANTATPIAPARFAAGEELAMLQYTSGSTSQPKGVMVSHHNLMANLAMITHAMGTTDRSDFVSWVPLHHDMGLILNALQTLYLGSRCVLMAPISFLHRPLAWLRAIQRFGAEAAGAPNFAYDLCVARFDEYRLEGLDLSGWKLAFNAAEPVRADTLRRFAETYRPYGFDQAAFYPCYGMAEATVFMTGGTRGDDPRIKTVDRCSLSAHRVAPATAADGCPVVGCGRQVMGEQLVVVDPQTRAACRDTEVGEIWAAGPHIARGYWRNTEASAATFGARLAEGREPFLRSGDLGFIDQGELYVTGRLKDVVIVRGANHYPQDIERTVERCHPALRSTGGAAFTVLHAESEVLVIVHEVQRTHRRTLDPADVVARIRQAVVAEFELSVHHVVLIKTGTIFKTSSGKIRRGRVRAAYLAGELAHWPGDDPPRVRSTHADRPDSAPLVAGGAEANR